MHEDISEGKNMGFVCVFKNRGSFNGTEFQYRTGILCAEYSITRGCVNCHGILS